MLKRANEERERWLLSTYQALYVTTILVLTAAVPFFLITVLAETS